MSRVLLVRLSCPSPTDDLFLSTFRVELHDVLLLSFFPVGVLAEDWWSLSEGVRVEARSPREPNPGGKGGKGRKLVGICMQN